MLRLRVKEVVVATLMFVVLAAMSACGAPQASSEAGESSNAATSLKDISGSLVLQEGTGDSSETKERINELMNGMGADSEASDEFTHLTSANGLVNGFIGEQFYDKPIENEEDAQAAVESVLTRIGGDDTTNLILTTVWPTESGSTYYTFRQEAGGVDVYCAALKLVVDKDNKVTGLVSSILPDAKADTLETWKVTQEEAENIVVDVCKTYDKVDVDIIKNATEQMLLPLNPDTDIMTYVWVVYTRNYRTDFDVAYMAHYVNCDGEYLYNIPVSEPGSNEAQTGEVATFAFQGMEPSTWTGTITRNDGSTEEITVPTMVDSETGDIILGDVERRILCADYADFSYNDSLTVRMQEGDGFDNNELAIYDTYIKVWDFYESVGWTGPDDDGTPTLLLMDMVTKDGEIIHNACYNGMASGFQSFAFNRDDPDGDCIDIIGHEFTHCITNTASTTNIYFNDPGAINESLSDILGNLVETEITGMKDNWILGENEADTPDGTVRSLKDPHAYLQPEHVWDVYYGWPASAPTPANDCGGVHINSSLLSIISYKLDQAGMSVEDQIYYWMNVELALVPTSDFQQLASILPWSMQQAGYPEYVDVVKKAVEEGRFALTEAPETPLEGASYIEVKLPEETSINLSEVRLVAVPADSDDINLAPTTWVGLDDVTALVAVPEGGYRLLAEFFEGEDVNDILAFTGDEWVSVVEEDDPLAKAENVELAKGDVATVTLNLK